MRFRREQAEDPGLTQAHAAFDARPMAEVRRTRVVQCREQRNRYLNQRGVSGQAIHGAAVAPHRLARRTSAIVAASFIALITLSAVFDALHLIRGNAAWLTLSYWGMGLGAAMGICATIASAVLWWSSPMGSTSRNVAVTLALGSVIVTALSSGSWIIRPDNLTDPGVIALLMGFMATGVGIVTGGVAGELIGGTSGQAPASVPQAARARRVPAPDVPDDEAGRIAVRA